MKDKDLFKDVFSEKLGNLEVPVRPELWSSISSQIGTTAATSVATGMSFLSKLIIGGSISAAVVAGAILLYPSKTEVKEIVNKNKLTFEAPSDEKSDKISETTSVKILNSKDIKGSKPLEFKYISCQFGSVVEDDFITPSFVANNIVSKSDVIETPNTSVFEELKPTTIKEDDKKVDSKPSVVDDMYITENKSSEKLILPNIFTPNNDGKADLFYIESNGLTNFSLVVFDSKNNIVFKSEDPAFRWDGVKLNGDIVEEGKYMYIVTAKDNLGKEISENSFLTISRN